MSLPIYGLRNALENLGSGGFSDPLPSRPNTAGGNDTYGNTGVPVVTGLPNAGTGSMGGEVTFTADYSQVQEAVAQVSAMVWVIDGLTGTVSITADKSAFDAAVSETSAAMWVVDALSATTTIGADKSGFDEAVAQVSAAMWVVDNMSATVAIRGDASHAMGVIANMSLYNGRTLATTYVDVVSRDLRSGSGAIARRATGGFVNEDMTLVGELGPELVSLPRGSYVHTNAETMRMMNSGKSSGQRQGGTSGRTEVAVTFTGNFYGSNREELDEWADGHLVPALVDAINDERRGQAR